MNHSTKVTFSWEILLKEAPFFSNSVSKIPFTTNIFGWKQKSFFWVIFSWHSHAFLCSSCSRGVNKSRVKYMKQVLMLLELKSNDE